MTSISETAGGLLPLISVIGASLALYGVAILAYRIFFHPLAKYPGPVLAKLTDLWPMYRAAQGDLSHKLLELHTKHGEIVRFGPNRVSFNTVEALENIYGFKANTRKSSFYYTFSAQPTQPSTHTAIDRGEHARKRRLVAQGLASRNMKELEPHILECTDIMMKNLVGSQQSREMNKGWSEPKDLGDWAGFFTVDVMGAVVFSQRFGLMESSELRWVKDGVGIAARGKQAVGFVPLIFFSGLDRYIWPKLTSVRLKMRGFAAKQLKDRLARKHDDSLHDVFKAYTLAKDPETGDSFGEKELLSESSLLISAGGDTTSTAISAAFFYLTKHTAVLAKAVKEVRSKFTDVDSIRPGPQLSACEYLRACIDESMRLAPPVPAALLREALPGGVTIKGHTFAAGTDLAVSAMAIMRNADYYSAPNEFNPERWFSSSADESGENLRMAKSAYCAFSIGARGCVGKTLAYNEMMSLMARVLWAFDIRRVPGSELGDDGAGNYKLEDVFVAEKQGPLVQFRPRQSE